MSTETATEIVPVENYKPDIALSNITQKAMADLESRYETLPDVSTKEGYDECKTSIRSLRDLRVSADRYRKKIKEPAYEWCDKVEEEWKSIKSRFQTMEDRFKGAKDLEDLRKKEEKEREIREENARIAKLDERIEAIKQMSIDAVTNNYNSEGLKECISYLTLIKIDEIDYQERTAEAEIIKEASIEQLNNMVKTQLENEENAKKLVEIEAQQKIDKIKAHIVALDTFVTRAAMAENSEQIKEVVNEVAAIDPEKFGDFKKEADEKLTNVYNIVKKMYEDKLKVEAVPIDPTPEPVDTTKPLVIVEDVNKTEQTEIKVIESHENADEQDHVITPAGKEYVKKMWADEAWNALVEIVDENSASLLMEALTAKSIPHVNCEWL